MFTLTLVTPEKRLVTGREVEEVFVPAYRGEINILPGHAPLMTTLQTGILRYRLQGESKEIAVAISWGYCQVNPHGVNILAETAELPAEIDVARAERAFKLATDRLSSSNPESEVLLKMQSKALRASVRKEVANMHTPGQA